MKKYLVILILFCSVFIFILIQKGNPILHKDPDLFAEQVNLFEGQDMGNKFIITCANFYAYPDKISKSVLYSQSFDEMLVRSCGKEMQRLADYLNQSDFQNVTAAELQQQTTWLHYFKSNKAKSS